MQLLPEPAATDRSSVIVLAIVATVGGLIAAFLYAVHVNAISISALMSFMDQHRKVAPVIFVILHTVAAMVFLPCSPFTALAGVLWDQPYAVIYSMAGAISGSCATFALGRTIGGDLIRNKLRHKAVTWAFAQVEARGWETVAFTQINPVFPASTLGYVFGLSRISFRVYLFTSVIFMLPLQLILVSLGQTLRNVLLPGDPTYLLAQLAIMVISGVALFALKPITRKLFTDGHR